MLQLYGIFALKNQECSFIKWAFFDTFTQENLVLHTLAAISLDNQIFDVQQYWNVFENLLISVVDEIIPLAELDGYVIKNNIPKAIKNKINKRNRVFKVF